MIISFIGVRGAGKTTQCQLLEGFLLDRGFPARVTKALDEGMKAKLLDLIPLNSFLANAFLFCMLYRRQVDQINRLVANGHVAITDRFIENFYLFHKHEGLLKTHGEAVYREFEFLVFENLRPTVMFYLKVDRETANKRIADRVSRGLRLDYMVETEKSYQRSVALYDELAMAVNCVSIDGLPDPAVVHRNVIAALHPWIHV